MCVRVLMHAYRVYVYIFRKNPCETPGDVGFLVWSFSCLPLLFCFRIFGDVMNKRNETE